MREPSKRFWYIAAVVGLLGMGWVGWWFGGSAGRATPSAGNPDAASTGPAKPAVLAREMPLWRDGMTWKVKVEFNLMSTVARSDPTPVIKPQIPDYTYTVVMTVAGSEALLGKDCWVLQMTVGPDAPERFRGWTYRLWVAMDDFMPVRLVKTEGAEEVIVDALSYGDMRIIHDVEYYAPVYMVPRIPNGTYTSTKYNIILDVKTEFTGDKIVASETRTRTGLPMETREEWDQGATMWRSYEFHSRGELRMKAVVLE